MMKPSKSLTSIVGQQQRQPTNGLGHNQRKQPEPKTNGHQSDLQPYRQQASNSAPTSPICRCRVMYLGSSVPHITKDGLQGIQEPLRELYPDKASLSSGNVGIDSWLSVWSNGILIENVDETGREMKRFFKIEALHYCAAVKYVPQAATNPTNGNATLPHDLASALQPKFLPLDSPHARLHQDSSLSPPIFASILRRTTGVKVLECHAFVCKREAAANALVRCCFHAYADTMYAKQIGAEVAASSAREPAQMDTSRRPAASQVEPISAARRTKSIAALNDAVDSDPHQLGQYSDTISQRQVPLRRKSLGNGRQQASNEASDDSASQRQMNYEESASNLQRQTRQFSKSLHQLDQVLMQEHSNQLAHEAQIFSHNPYASRVPSYPPQNIIDQQQQMQTISGGTLRSVKSMAANSIASTLLRSKKHAKAMSMAQLNQQQQMMMSSQPMSFHQHQQNLAANTLMTMPPVPPMFMPRAGLINGSQTMNLPSRHLLQAVAPMPMNFEAMTPKEMKKMLKKSAKYGLNANHLADPAAGLPLLPLRPIQMPMPIPGHLPGGMQFGPESIGGTFNSESMFAHSHKQDPQGPFDMVDFGGFPPNLHHNHQAPPPPPPPHLMDQMQQQPQQPIKSILVKPNPEFLKSKAGKKWLKQQKEFKKLLPAHLDGLPIVFGPPPPDALESVGLPPPPPGSTLNGPLHPFAPAPPSSGMGGMPLLDSNGFYNPHPLYGPSGRASAASTLVRNSPQVIPQQSHVLDKHMDYMQRTHSNHHQQQQQQQQQLYHVHPQHNQLYSNPELLAHGQNQAPLPPPPPPMLPPHQSRTMPAVEHYGGQLRSMDRSQRRRRRNHMVEQSVISLGDEDNEDEGDEVGEEEEDEEDEVTENDYERTHAAAPPRRPQRGGLYDGVELQSATGYSDRHSQRAPARRVEDQQAAASNGYEHHHQQQQRHSSDIYQDDYEQIAQRPQADDSRSNSSGIYRRRNHMNERAFSYSIQQEASKSSADNSDAEYRNGAELVDLPTFQHNNNNLDYSDGMQHYDAPQQANFYQPRHRPSQQPYKEQLVQRQQQMDQQRPVNELTARLENQLSMKSFANSCVQ